MGFRGQWRGYVGGSKRVEVRRWGVGGWLSGFRIIGLRSWGGGGIGWFRWDSNGGIGFFGLFAGMGLGRWDSMVWMEIDVRWLVRKLMGWDCSLGFWQGV